MDKQNRREKHKRNQAQKNKHKPQHVKEKLRETQNESNETDSYKTRDETDENFSKRKLVNNWSKYEEKEEEKIYGDRMRGADYNEIIQIGNVGSAFKLSEEKTWDEDLKNETKINEFFTVDLKDLNDAFLCIPLPKRLLIDSDVFPRKIANKMEKMAQQNLALYLEGKLKTEQIIRDIFYEEKENEKLNENVEENVEENEIEEIFNDFVNPKNEISDLEKDLNDLLSFNTKKIDLKDEKNTKTDKSNIKTTETKPLQLFTETKTEKLEDWLDTLLETD